MELRGEQATDLCVCCAAAVQHYAWSHKTIKWKLVQRRALRVEVAWRVDMRSSVRAQADLRDFIAVDLVG